MSGSTIKGNSRESGLRPQPGCRELGAAALTAHLPPHLRGPGQHRPCEEWGTGQWKLRWPGGGIHWVSSEGHSFFYFVFFQGIEIALKCALKVTWDASAFECCYTCNLPFYVRVYVLSILVNYFYAKSRRQILFYWEKSLFMADFPICAEISLS